MPSQYERDEAVRRAKGMLGGGFEANYIYEKLLAERFNEDEAVAIVKEVTGKAFVKPIKAESKPIEAPANFMPQAKTPKAEAKPIEIPMSLMPQPEAPKAEAKPIEIPMSLMPQPEQPKVEEEAAVSLASLMEAPKAENSDEDEEDEPEFLDTLDEKLEAADEESEEGYLPEEESIPEPVIAVSSPEPTKQETSQPIHDAYRRQEAKNLATTLFNGGYGPEYIKNKLLGRGFTEEEIKAAVAPLAGKNSYMKSTGSKKNSDYRYTPQASSSNANGQVILGVLMILFGCGMAFFAFQGGSNNSSSRAFFLVIALIIGGAFRVFKGLSDS